jgi:hypothetical protein
VASSIAIWNIVVFERSLDELLTAFAPFWKVRG